jgi:hypothetical protein
LRRAIHWIWSEVSQFKLMLGRVQQLMSDIAHSKAACLFELYLSGVSFYVLPDDFLVHQSHEYAEAARKNERKYNRKLYLDFREELCFRYLTNFISNGKLKTLISKNLLTECKKIKGFSGAAGKFITANLGKEK